MKWPNDLLVDDRKLGGILIELRAESAGPACVIIGIGLNVALGAPLLEKIATMGLAPTDLAAAGLKESVLQKALRAVSTWTAPCWSRRPRDCCDSFPGMYP